jgi:hypothetical protein
MSEQPTLTPRDALRFILFRYDHGAMAPGVFAVAKELQRHLSSIQHVNRARERDAAQARLGRPAERPPISRDIR